MNLGTLDLHGIDVKDFFKTVDCCKGNVYLETADGDVLNLKSKLCQLISIAQLIEGGVIEKARVRCDEVEDEALLFRFNLYREIPE